MTGLRRSSVTEKRVSIGLGKGVIAALIARLEVGALPPRADFSVVGECDVPADRCKAFADFAEGHGGLPVEAA